LTVLFEILDMRTLKQISENITPCYIRH